MKIFLSGSSHDDIKEDYIKLAREVSKLFSNADTIIIGGIPSTFPKNSMMGEYNTNFKNHEYITVEKYDSATKPHNSQVLYYTMDRTKEIYKLSDIIIILPGGLGTLAELASFLEESRTNKTNKKIIIFNYKGYYDNILTFIDKALNNNFIYKNDITTYQVVNNIEELKKEMER